MNQTQPCARLGEYLRRRREGLGWSLGKVEELSRQHSEPIRRAYLSKVERGQLAPAFTKLVTLAQVYNVSIETFAELVDLEGHGQVAPSDDDPRRLRELGMEAEEHGKHYRAVACYEKALELLTEGPDADASGSDLQVKTCVDLGMVLRRMGKFRLAEEYLKLALSAGSLDDRIKAHALTSLASVYKDCRVLHLAEAVSAKAAVVAETVDDVSLRYRIFVNYANVLSLQQRWSEAIPLYREGVAGFERLGDKASLILAEQNLARALVRNGSVTDGLSLHARSVVNALTLSDTWLLVAVRLAYAESLLAAKRIERAVSLLHQCNKVARIEGYTSHLFTGTFHLWEHARASQDERETRSLFRRLRTLRVDIGGRSPETDRFDHIVEQMRSDDDGSCED